MRWIREPYITDFLTERNYDVRVSGNARWIDQKCAADVITIIADCILQYVEGQPNVVFTSMDIWHGEYTIANVENIFKKPNPDEKKARNEYDKFFQQPMEMLAYAGILRKIKETEKSGRNFYQVADGDLLEYLAVRERNSLTFLNAYITKVLTDSGLIVAFEKFFDKQTKDAYFDVKEEFSTFTIANTKINGKVECNRIFIKILNPLAFTRSKLGTKSGRISKNKITLDMLMYNRDNFRDINKPKEMTRRQYAEKVGELPMSRYTAYISQKAKRVVRAFNDSFRGGFSEVIDAHQHNEKAINIHHIFPETEYPEISMYYENLIALTPTQHFNYAHQMGNTHYVDRSYQNICLIAKAAIIQETIADLTREQIYEFRKFMYVLVIGLDCDVFEHIANDDFDSAVREINLAYV